MAKSPEELAHIEWLGYVQPVGLVVSIPAMLEAQCYVNKNIMGEHARFLDCLVQNDAGVTHPEVRDLREFVQAVLGWEAEDLVDVPTRQVLSGDMAKLEVVLPQYNETLRPTHAVSVFKPEEDQNPWMLLIQEWPATTDLDEAGEADSSRHWNASPQAKFERLLRETEVPIGLLSNGRSLRLVYSPRGETSGFATFNVDEMAQVAGRPMFAALQMLLSSERLFSMGANQRLPAILANSRKYQNTVSTKLAEQVLAALYELMRGFQAANDVRNCELLSGVLARDPNQVYSGLLTVLMRLVFILYAEDRDLLSSDPVYSNHYSVTGLFNRLREDAGRHPDTMNQRFGAWSQLITLFRLVYEGGQHGDFKLPARKGYLFDPERYPFLEGRSGIGFQPVDGTDDRQDAYPTIPRVSDGVIYNVLRNLLILDGERLSYRTLDVEQIGSVYETVMGFNLEVARGKSIAIKPVKTHGAPATINLDVLLATSGKDRAKWLKEHGDQSLGKEMAKLLKDAETIEHLLTALDKKIQKKVTPRVVPTGAIVLQPSDERRRSGSHYTPRSLTEPIVRTTLEPILKQLCDPQTELPAVYQPTREDKKRYTAGELDARVRASEKAIKNAKLAREIGTPHPSQILELKICDPAMGSGAFLVEACRQLGDHLVGAWAAHGLTPTDIPPDEDEVLYARRLVAQRCLYGVDKNDMAVDLAKLSLWLVTLAKDHPFTFLDHSLRHGDSLVGLTRRQIIGFHWEPKKQKQFGEDLIQKRLDKATEARAKILNAREDVTYRDQEQKLAIANEALNVVRLTGDACVSAFFAGSKKKEREVRCEELFGDVARHYQNLKDGKFDVIVRDRIAQAAASLRTCEHPIPPFHWEIEFPEVFSRENGGFDGFVGNPPFLGGSYIWPTLGGEYRDFIKEAHRDTGGKSVDLVAHFFRQCFMLLRRDGAFSLIATNTIAQGNTRDAGLRSICKDDGTIYSASTRMRWPGEAAVVVSVVSISKGEPRAQPILNENVVKGINSLLMPIPNEVEPHKLKANARKSFTGHKTLGMGFVFDDTESKGVSIPMAELVRLAKNRHNADRIRPYLGGEEINSSPTHANHRFVIDLNALTLDEAKSWPELLAILKERVYPERAKLGGYSVAEKRSEYWWRYGTYAAALQAAISFVPRFLARSQVSDQHSLAFLPSKVFVSHGVVAFPFHSFSAFAVLQSRPHEYWARFLGSSMKDDLRYTATECFETFPLAKGFESDVNLNSIGSEYYEFRAERMVSNNEGLTKTYNRFHDPHEKSPEIQKLRELHAAMDRAVLEAYGWHDLAQIAHCEFLLDYEEEDDETELSSGGGKKKSKKKKPWRLRWPDEFRDKVLARLLELNEQRHKEELLLAKSKKDQPKDEKPKSKSPRKAAPTPLFDELDRDEAVVLMIVQYFRLITRRAVDEAFIAMRSPKLRKSRLGLGDPPKTIPRTDAGRDALIGGLIEKGYLAKRPSDVQQVLQMGSVEPPLGDLSAADQTALEETRAIFQRAIDDGNDLATCYEEVTDARPGLVSAA